MQDKTKMGEQQGPGQGEAKMEDSRVSEANRAPVVNTLCLMSQEFPSTTFSWEGKAVVAFCWGENGQGRGPSCH